jgi:hypothetical protein
MVDAQRYRMNAAECLSADANQLIVISRSPSPLLGCR